MNLIPTDFIIFLIISQPNQTQKTALTYLSNFNVYWKTQGKAAETYIDSMLKDVIQLMQATLT